ncbi:MAG: hypothetical protein Q8O33_13675, partial [Pseudomonadota bacterium]|nr:hypothetical protein [Pseudomonadota bacterium]
GDRRNHPLLGCAGVVRVIANAINLRCEQSALMPNIAQIRAIYRAPLHDYRDHQITAAGR